MPKFKSKLEEKVWNTLIKEYPSVQYEPTRIKFTQPVQERTYTPDFKVDENREIFVDGIGDLFFGTCRLANQLGVDVEEAFNLVKTEILAKYDHTNPENNIVRK